MPREQNNRSISLLMKLKLAPSVNKMFIPLHVSVELGNLNMILIHKLLTYDLVENACSLRRGWTRWFLKVTSNLKIFYDSVITGQAIGLFPKTLQMLPRISWLLATWENSWQNSCHRNSKPRSFLFYFFSQLSYFLSLLCVFILFAASAGLQIHPQFYLHVPKNISCFI